jgi:hypothetical protein
MSFAAAVTNTRPLGQTANGMPVYTTSDNPVLDLFSIIGSSRGKNIEAVFLKSLEADPRLTIKTLFYARDVREGLGERQVFRQLLQTVERADPELAIRLVTLVPEYGRWDDLLCFQTPTVQKVAAATFAQSIQFGNALACKWAPRQGSWANLIRKSMGLKTPKKYRQLVVASSQTVEQLMCAKNWAEINYEHVPSVAAARYQKSFLRQDPIRYTEFKTQVKQGTATVKSQVLYPYDVLRSLKHGDAEMAQEQWNSLSNFLGDEKILPMVDTSGSMGVSVGGNTSSRLTCMDVAVSLGLYIADKQQGAFQNLFLTFSGETVIQELSGDLKEKYNQLRVAHWGTNTNLERAFREILRVAVMNDVQQSEMPSTLLILSDLEFDGASDGNTLAWDMVRDAFARHNYSLPKIVWWNLNARPGNSPVRQHTSGAALVSGFSTTALKSILRCENMSPLKVMLEALEQPRYNVINTVVG